MLRLLKRSVETAVKLPFAIAWDAISLLNLGEGSSTQKILREHELKKYLDDVVEVTEKVEEIKRLK